VTVKQVRRDLVKPFRKGCFCLHDLTLKVLRDQRDRTSQKVGFLFREHFEVGITFVFQKNLCAGLEFALELFQKRQTGPYLVTVITPM